MERCRLKADESYVDFFLFFAQHVQVTSTQGGKKRQVCCFSASLGKTMISTFITQLSRCCWEAEGKYTHRTDLCIMIVTSKLQKKGEFKKGTISADI